MTIYAMLDVVKKLEKTRLLIANFLALWLWIWIYFFAVKGINRLYVMYTFFFFQVLWARNLKLHLLCVCHEIDRCNSIYRSGETKGPMWIYLRNPTGNVLFFNQLIRFSSLQFFVATVGKVPYCVLTGATWLGAFET